MAFPYCIRSIKSMHLCAILSARFSENPFSDTIRLFHTNLQETVLFLLNFIFIEKGKKAKMDAAEDVLLLQKTLECILC